MNRYWQIALAVLLSLASACNKYTSVKPESKDLDGIYRPTLGTQALFAKQGYGQTNDISIILHGDGKFELHNMPDCWLSSLRSVDLPHKLYDSGDGEWVITDNGMDGNDAWGATFEFHSTTNLVSIKKEMKAIVVVGGTMFKKEKAPYILNFFIGEPDGSPLCEFHQELPVKK